MDDLRKMQAEVRESVKAASTIHALRVERDALTERVKALERMVEALDVPGDEYPERKVLQDLQTTVVVLRRMRGQLRLALAIRIEHYLARLDVALGALDQKGDDDD